MVFIIWFNQYSFPEFQKSLVSGQVGDEIQPELVSGIHRRLSSMIGFSPYFENKNMDFSGQTIIFKEDNKTKYRSKEKLKDEDTGFAFNSTFLRDDPKCPGKGAGQQFGKSVCPVARSKHGRDSLDRRILG
jgi:hypothetical protein